MYTNKALKELIEKSQLSHEKAAEAMDISLNTFRSYIRDVQPAQPCIENIIKMADFFAVPIDVLVGRCSEEQYNEIMNDYEHKFHLLRGEAYKNCIAGRKPFFEGKLMVEAGWPYNLLNAIFGNNVEWEITPRIKENIEKALNSLTLNRDKYLRYYFFEGLSINEVANKFKVSRERARQVITHGLRCLRNPAISKTLRPEYTSFEELQKHADKTASAFREKENSLSAWEESLVKREGRLESCLLYMNKHGMEDVAARIENEKKGFKKEFIEPPVLLMKDIADIGLSVRCYNILKRAGLNTVQDVLSLLHKKPFEVYKLRNMGEKNYVQMLQVFDELFGTDLYSDTYSPHKIIKEKFKEEKSQ